MLQISDNNVTVIYMLCSKYLQVHIFLTVFLNLLYYK